MSDPLFYQFWFVLRDFKALDETTFWSFSQFAEDEMAACNAVAKWLSASSFNLVQLPLERWQEADEPRWHVEFTTKIGGEESPVQYVLTRRATTWLP